MQSGDMTFRKMYFQNKRLEHKKKKKKTFHCSVLVKQMPQELKLPLNTCA